ncbi:MAG: hypothetical protein H6Q89_5142 [Myxococcaceae bacterium]|nr:hypothetical protein [Myxococcaceae bacterium]
MFSRYLFSCVLAAACGWAGDASAAPRRPAVDVAAMREAMSSTQEPDEQFASAASYAHFMRARLAHHEGDHRLALDELRLALASDDANPFLLTQLAEQYARLTELERAELTLKKALERNANYQPAQLLMGRVLYEAQKVTRARAHLQRAIKLKPRDTDAYLVLTQLWLDQNKPDEAVKVVEELAAALPGEPVGYRRLGLALAERGDLVRAERLLTKAVDRDPGDVESWVALATLLEASNRLARAEQAYAAALERDPENREVLLSAGRLALRLDSIVLARAYFDQLLALSRDPEVAVKVAFSYLAMHRLSAAAEVLDSTRTTFGEPRLHFYAGLVHERMRSWGKAADAYAAVGRDSGELFHEARLHRAISLSSLGQHVKAIDLLRKGLDERPDYQALIPAYARALERGGQLKEAESVLGKAVNERPAPEVFEALSGLYERGGRLGEAVNVLTQALKRRPKDELLLYALGTVYERKGETQKSLEKMRSVLDVNPDNANAMNFIGYLLADNGRDFDEAERLLTRALELKPDNASYLDSLGWVYFRRGELEKAVETLQRANTVSPNEPTINEHLGDAWAKAQKKKDAAEAYQRALNALKEDPDLAESKGQRSGIEKKLKALEEK